MAALDGDAWAEKAAAFFGYITGGANSRTVQRIEADGTLIGDPVARMHDEEANELDVSETPIRDGFKVLYTAVPLLPGLAYVTEDGLRYTCESVEDDRVSATPWPSRAVMRRHA